MSMRRKLTEKLQERTALLEKAEGLLQEGNREEYRTQMDAVKAMNGEIEEIKSLIQEQDRKFMEKAPDLAEERDKAAERGNLLMKGQEVKFTALEVTNIGHSGPAHRGGHQYPGPPGQRGGGHHRPGVRSGSHRHVQLPGALCNLGI